MCIIYSICWESKSMNSPAKVATLLCFCSRSRSPWQTAWIQSSCLQMKPLLLPGVTRVCQLLGCQLRTLPSWPPVSVGHSSPTHSNRASNGFGAGSTQIWGWCSWDREGESEYQTISWGAQNVFINVFVYLPFCHRRYLDMMEQQFPEKVCQKRSSLFWSLSWAGILFKHGGEYLDGSIKIRTANNKS